MGRQLIVKYEGLTFFESESIRIVARGVLSLQEFIPLYRQNREKIRIVCNCLYSLKEQRYIGSIPSDWREITGWMETIIDGIPVIVLG